MKLAEALEWIKNHPRIDFAVKFLKKDNSIRLMNCKSEFDDGNLVKNPLLPRAVDFKANDLIPVYDTDVKGYRSFSTTRLVSIKIDGQWHQIEEAEKVFPSPEQK